MKNMIIANPVIAASVATSVTFGAMLENCCYRAGEGTNVFVAVTGGVWDMDNRNQRQVLIRLL